MICHSISSWGYFSTEGFLDWCTCWPCSGPSVSSTMWLCSIEPRSWRRYNLLIVSCTFILTWYDFSMQFILRLGPNWTFLYWHCCFPHPKAETWGTAIWNLSSLWDSEQEGEGDWFFNEDEVMSNVIGGDRANNHVDLAEVICLWPVWLQQRRDCKVLTETKKISKSVCFDFDEQM
jgi:hypothetical protein